MPLHVSSWQYGVVAFSIISGTVLVWIGLAEAKIEVSHSAMSAIVTVLVLVHKRLRLKRYREIREYYDEQMW